MQLGWLWVVGCVFLVFLSRLQEMEGGSCRGREYRAGSRNRWNGRGGRPLSAGAACHWSSPWLHPRLATRGRGEGTPPPLLGGRLYKGAAVATRPVPCNMSDEHDTDPIMSSTIYNTISKDDMHLYNSLVSYVGQHCEKLICQSELPMKVSVFWQGLSVGRWTVRAGTSLINSLGAILVLILFHI